MQKKSNRASRGTSPHLRTVTQHRRKTARRILSIMLLAAVVLLVLLLTRVIRPADWFHPPTASSSGTIPQEPQEPNATASATLIPSLTAAALPSPSPAVSTSLETSGPSGDASPSSTAPAAAEKSPPASAPATQAASGTPSPGTSLRTPGHENMPIFGTVASHGNLSVLEKKVRSLVATFPGTYGVTFVNLATGERFGVNDTQEYIAASTSKFPMNVLLWKRIAAGEIDPESMLVYLKEDFESGTGIIQNQPFGTEYSVRTTSRYSVIHSDNCGINMIIRLLGIEDIRQYLRDLGGVVEYGKTHRSCPADMANVAVDLYKFYEENPAVAGELVDFLEHTDWNERINGLLPKEVRVAHKIGNQTRTANDVGIIFARQPYVLSVMTDKVDFDAACRNIARLSKMIYDHLEGQP